MLRAVAVVLICLASVLVTASCAGGGPGTRQADPSPTLTIKGHLAYRARIALPPQSIAIVELKETSAAAGRVVAEQRMELKGRQVPVPFELKVDRAQLLDGRPYTVRGAFYLDGRATWVSDPKVIEPTAGVIDLGTLNMSQYTAQAFASDLQCGDETISIGFVDKLMRLTAGERTFEMGPVASASGAKYEAVGDPTTTLWNQGDETTVVIKGKAYPPCRKAGREAKPFRATGNEPGWRLDIGASEMILLADHGTRRIVVPTPAAETTPQSRTYSARNGGQDLTVRIFDRPCTDNMSGMPHPSTVVLRFEGRTLNGCGGDPADLLRGAEWIVEDITGVRLLAGSRITLTFGADGELSGMASCNRYGAQYALTGEGLTISKAFSTMMECEPPLMKQEQEFLDVLGRVQRFELGPDGALILHTGDRRSIRARRG